jgi:hypothetical protein
MYLEISGRQTGKTSRLVKAAAYAAIDTFLSDENRDIVVFGISKAEEKRIYLKIEYEVKSYIKIPSYLDPKYYHEIMRNVHLGNSNALYSYDKALLFYDEFDFYRGNVIPRYDGYYATTPKHIRKYLPRQLIGDDTLRDLINLNDGKYAKHTPTFDYSNANYTQEQFEVEYLGKWNSLGE